MYSYETTDLQRLQNIARLNERTLELWPPEHLEGVIHIRPTDQGFQVSWDEWPAKHGWNDDLQTLEETHNFETLEQVEEFLIARGIALDVFLPEP